MGLCHVLFWIYLSLSVLTPQVSSAVVIETKNVTSPSPKTVREIEKEIEKLITSATKFVMPYFVRNSDLNISSSCMSTFIKVFVDVRKLKLPALKLLDAMPRPTYGLLKGSFAVMGDYDECLSVRTTKKGDVPQTPEEEYYHGQYCTIEAKFPPQILQGFKDYGSGKSNLSEYGKLAPFLKELPASNFAADYFTFHIGVCVPSTCSIGDVKKILEIIPVDFVPLKVLRCEDNQKKQLMLDQVIFIAVLVMLVVLVVSGTAVDAWMHVQYPLYHGDNKDKFCEFFVAFSAYSNTKRLFQTEKTHKLEVSAINGMYVWGTFLVVLYHTYFLPFNLLFTYSSSNLGLYMKDFDFTLVVTMGISIEAYFLFSGLVLVLPRFRNEKKIINVNVIKIIFRRYIRLCPSLLFILGVIVLMPLFGSGPVWTDIFEKAADNTRKWWWKYALMFNNFLAVKDQNFLYLWFIPCLMQISIIGAFILWIMAKSPRIGMSVIIATGLGCNIALGVLTYLRNYPPTYAIYYYHNREHFEETIYTSPLSHVSSFGIGMALGYYMAKNQSLRWSRVHVVCGWVVSLFCTVGIQLIMYVGRDGTDPDPVLSAVYAATHRTLFSLGLAWIILACSNGYGGVLAKLMCWRGFGPLSKLGYFGYLIHYIVITYHVSVTRVPLQYSHYENLMRVAGYTTVTFFAAYVLYITFELPLTYVESLFLPSRTPLQDPVNNVQQNGKKDDKILSQLNEIVTTNKAPWNEDRSGYLGTIPEESSKL